MLVNAGAMQPTAQQYTNTAQQLSIFCRALVQKAQAVQSRQIYSHARPVRPRLAHHRPPTAALVTQSKEKNLPKILLQTSQISSFDVVPRLRISALSSWCDPPIIIT